MEQHPTKQELLNRIGDFEDNFTERKPDSANDREIRKTIVAFANSSPEGRTAVLYVGIGNDGEVLGVQSPDSQQKRISRICSEDCYPPIIPVMEVIEKGGRNIVAVILKRSNDRPHFSGPAFIREGSKSIVASRQLFDEMVTSRLSKPHEILE